MKYVTYMALMFGAAYAKQIVIDIDEAAIKDSMRIERQADRKLFNDPEFSNAANQVGGDAVNELSKAQAKFITHERGILMPSVRALTRVMNAIFIKDRHCSPTAFERCLSAVPEPVNPFSSPPEWNHGRLKQCTKESYCKAKYNFWTPSHKRKWARGTDKKIMQAAKNVEKLATAYERAYFKFAQRNTKNFDVMANKFMESQKERAQAYGCNQACVDQCFSSYDAYGQCTAQSVQYYPQW